MKNIIKIDIIDSSKKIQEKHMEILVAVILLCGIIMLLRSAYEFTKKKRHTAATLQVGHIYQTRCGDWSVEIFFDDLLAPFSSGGVAQNLTTGHKTLHSWTPEMGGISPQ